MPIELLLIVIVERCTKAAADQHDDENGENKCDLELAEGMYYNLYWR